MMSPVCPCYTIVCIIQSSSKQSETVPRTRRVGRDCYTTCGLYFGFSFQIIKQEGENSRQKIWQVQNLEGLKKKVEAHYGFVGLKPAHPPKHL